MKQYAAVACCATVTSLRSLHPPLPQQNTQQPPQLGALKALAAVSVQAASHLPASFLLIALPLLMHHCLPSFPRPTCCKERWHPLAPVLAGRALPTSGFFCL
jgi:hypothetical protein